MDQVILDTDMLSEVFKGRNPIVLSNAATYLQVHQRLTFSAVTRYEVLRGLKSLHATTQLRRFAVVCGNSTIVQLNDAIFDRAADLWAYGRQNGHSADDADLLIGATALELNCAVATGNSAHFQWQPGVRTVNWRDPP